MKSQISLLVLAAGMGSRYGGLKQMESFGPSGETIIDYSVYDAIKAGFNKVVFIIRPDMEEDFRRIFLHKYQGRIDIDYCFQTVDMLPSWYKRSQERTKPWGTAHALLCAREILDEPFLVINGDDFYGRESFDIASRFLKERCSKDVYGIPVYRLENVLSDAGAVKRGICTVKDESLVNIVETFEIAKDEKGEINGVAWDGKLMKDISGKALVSMNMFCVHPSIFEKLPLRFEEFLRENEDELKGEFLLPTEFSRLINEGAVKMKVLETPAIWCGVTYPEDAEVVRRKLEDLVKEGEYPENLWS